MGQQKDIIIGAGISGLACGYTLRDALVLEKEPFIGGLCRTVRVDGFRFDLGGHRFFTHHQHIDAFVRELLQETLLSVNRKSKIYRNNRFIDYPLKISVVFQLSPWNILWALCTYLFRKFSPRQEISFKDKAINRFGDHLYSLFFRDYTEKVWGIPCVSIDKSLVGIRLQNISLLRVVRDIFKKDTKNKTLADTFVYPQHGIVQLAEALARGLDIRVNSEVTSLTCSENKIERVIVNHQDAYGCRNLISTMPLPQLVKFLNPPEEVATASRELKYRSLVLVFLILNRKKYTDNHWIYFPENQIFGRLHEPKNWSSDMSPQEKTGICMELFCDKDDEVWRMSDIDIAHQVIRDLPLLERFEMEDHFVERVEYAYPVYDLQHRKNLHTVKDYLARYKNLFLLGRTGAFRYDNIDVCLEEGLAMGEVLLAKAKDALSPSG